MLSVIAIFDIGKTNKKFFLFDNEFNLVLEKTIQLDEIKDEDGDPCEDLTSLTDWVKKTFQETLSDKKYSVVAINFSTYGASFVHLDRQGKPVAPLYNYLKTYPDDLKKKFYDTYGGQEKIASETASPTLGNLNSGMLLYWLKHKRPEIFKKIAVSLHLPQYVSSLFTGHYCSDITSIGCHTQLWDFKKNNYHDWVFKEGIYTILAPIAPSDSVVTSTLDSKVFQCGLGLHDSSSALIPYLKLYQEPFMLLSTGTWSISLNPFNGSPLTKEELDQDCLCFLSYERKPVKASRLFSGYEHEQQTKKLATHFHIAEDYFKTVPFQPMQTIHLDFGVESDLSVFKNYEEAYCALIKNLVVKQMKSSNLIMNQSVKRIFVDGGFSKNVIFMKYLAEIFPAMEVFATSLAQASALGAASIIMPSSSTQYLKKHFSIQQY
jgi:sugar (pentulose or hexulose) kinase